MTACMSYWAFNLVKHDCANMTQNSLLFYGIVCFLEAMINMVNALSSVGGRLAFQDRRDLPGQWEGHVSTVKYIVTVAMRPFF